MTRRRRLTTHWPATLKKLRARHKLSQAEAASKIGAARATWIAWEHGWAVPSSANVELMIDRLGLKLPK